MDFLEFWQCITKKRKPLEKDLLIFKYLNNMVNDIVSMFEIKELPSTIDEYFFNSCLLLNGSVGIFKDNRGNLICARGGDTDGANIYGYGDKYLATTVNGEDEKIFTKGIDGAAIYNNHTRTPDYNIPMFAKQFAELEISENRNVLWSRVMPIPYADDVKEQSQIEQAINNTIEGKVATVVSSNVQDFQREFFGKERKQPLMLSDIRNIPFLQYLSEYRDVLNRRFYTLYGHALQMTAKHAQVSRDEINGLNSVSWILPLNMLKERQKGLETVNALFGTNISIGFAEPWKSEIEKYYRMTENADNGEGEQENANNEETE